MPGNHPKKQRLYNVLFRMVWGNISKIFQKHFKPTNLIQQIKNLLIYQRKYDRLYHVKVITYFHARVAQGWSTTLPRWGPRVRIPSRAFLLHAGDCAASSPAFCFFQIQSLYKAMGRRPHAGQPSHFHILFLIAGPAPGFYLFCLTVLRYSMIPMCMVQAILS